MIEMITGKLRLRPDLNHSPHSFTKIIVQTLSLPLPSNSASFGISHRQKKLIDNKHRVLGGGGPNPLRPAPFGYLRAETLKNTVPAFGAVQAKSARGDMIENHGFGGTLRVCFAKKR